MAITSRTTLVDYVVPSSLSRSTNLLKDFLLVLGFSLFVAVCAFIAIPLPFTPVPITLQPSAVLLAGAALGGRRGAVAMLIYLAEGATGLPVFAGGTGGLLHLIGPTAGYLWSYPIAAFVTGLLCERGLDRSYWTSVFAMLPGTLIIYALGVPWLAVVLHINATQAFVAGMLPFIPGDLLKLAIASALLPSIWQLVRKIKPDNSAER